MKLSLQSLPLAQGLRGYRLPWLRNDISAGLAIAAVGLPSAIAYPAIAGLPPETGLYASITPLVAYALFGPSRQLIVGPDAATMTVLAAAMAAVLAAAPEADRVAIAAAMALCVGTLCLLARVLHLGIIASFLSRPILIGFFAGISLSIMIGQIKRVTGVPIDADGLISPLLELARKAGLIHWPSLILALAMFALLQMATALRLPIPGPVLVVVISVVLSLLFDFRGHGIAVVGDVPTMLPRLHLPAFTNLPFDLILSGSAAIFLVSFGAGIVTARSFGARGGYHVDADRELVGFGAANIAAGLYGAFPVTASDSRTAINTSVGGRSQIASIVAAATLLATVLFLSDALRILPVPALGAILVAAAISLIDLNALRQIWRISPMEFVFALIALFGPIGLGVLYGVVIAIGATLLYVLRQMMFPREAMLGRIPGRDGFYKLHRTPSAHAVPGLAITIVQGSLLFFNSDYVEARLRAIAETLPSDTQWFVLDASAIAQVDSTGAGMLDDFANDLAKRGIAIGLAELHADARALLERAGVLETIGPAMVFDDLEDALRAFEARGDSKPKTQEPS
ncbi:SulP family inorganic anion transporter [Mesorhizobium sp. IMUNJ 23232]|uniref:SulP family inorganic anion transporter n=1 Tax=Mesorhizobium sp. IMUNJ 23232 TaxID=3376064 RepID=UPI00379DC049